MKPILTQQQIKLIEQTASKINALSAQQDRIYDDLLETLDIKLDSDEEPWIFDSVYNDCSLEEASM